LERFKLDIYNRAFFKEWGKLFIIQVDLNKGHIFEQHPSSSCGGHFFICHNFMLVKHTQTLARGEHMAQ